MKNIKYLVSSIALLLFMNACSHKNIEPQLGPSYCTETVQALSNNVSGEADFTKEADTIKAILKGNGNWKIKITGLTSKAVKYFKGNSLVVNQLWYGENDSTLFFQAGEDCKVELFTNCQSTQTSIVKIKSNADFSKSGYFFDDFESNKSSFTTVPGKFAKGTTPQINDKQLYHADSSVNPIQGNAFYRFAGLAEAYFIGDISNFIAINKLKLVFGDTITSEDVNLSFYINFNGLNSANITVEFLEGEFTRSLSFTNPENLKGWKLITMPLSDFGVKNPLDLVSLKFKPGFAQSGGRADISLDLIRLTKVDK